MGQVSSQVSDGAKNACDRDPMAVLNSAVTDIQTRATQYTNALNNTTSQQTPLTQLNNLNNTLTKQIEDLRAQKKSLISSIERQNRDFIDVDQATEPNISSIHTLDDYTLWMLLLSYLFFAIAIIFWYSHTNNYTPSAIGISVGGMTVISFFMVVVGIIVL